MAKKKKPDKGSGMVCPDCGSGSHFEEIVAARVAHPLKRIYESGDVDYGGKRYELAEEVRLGVRCTECEFESVGDLDVLDDPDLTASLVPAEESE